MDTVEKVSVVQQVEQRLREYIAESDIMVGDKLPTEKQLCENLGVGRGTVREAIRMLQAQGFVEIRPGRGAFVLQKREAQKEDIVNWFCNNEYGVRDLLDIRVALEPLAVKLAIKGMLPKNSIGRSSLLRCKIYEGDQHNNAAQKPEMWAE